MIVVYGVYRNGDMTEGRGPMVLDTIFTTEKLAMAYANCQLGVMGTKPYKIHAAGQSPLCDGWFCTVCGSKGHWTVRPLSLHDQLPADVLLTDKQRTGLAAVETAIESWQQQQEG